MSCFRQAFSCLKSTYEWLYEPMKDLEEEELLWKHPRLDSSSLWSDVQTRKKISKPLSPYIEKALTILEERNIDKGVAVDLGCGISPTIFNLLERGWKVYAVDNSIHVLSDLSTQITALKISCFETGQLVLLNENIENFEFPEKVDLVIATDALPYCNPKKIQEIFCRMHDALLPNGIAVFNLYLSNHIKVYPLFSTWTTTKSVIESVILAAKFISIKAIKGDDLIQYHFIAS